MGIYAIRDVPTLLTSIQKCYKAKQSSRRRLARYCELELRTDTMQKGAKNAKAASVKINSMFWTKVLFVFYLLSHLDKHHGKSYQG